MKVKDLIWLLNELSPRGTMEVEIGSVYGEGGVAKIEDGYVMEYDDGEIISTVVLVADI